MNDCITINEVQQFRVIVSFYFVVSRFSHGKAFISCSSLQLPTTYNLHISLFTAGGFLWYKHENHFNMNRFSKFIETIHLAWFIAARSHSMPFYSLGSLLWVWFIPILLPSLIHVFTCIMLLSAEKCFSVEMIRLLFGMVLCNAWFAWAWECQYFRPFLCVCVCVLCAKQLFALYLF